MLWRCAPSIPFRVLFAEADLFVLVRPAELITAATSSGIGPAADCEKICDNSKHNRLNKQHATGEKKVRVFI